MTAQFIVLDGLPDTLRRGVFEMPCTFDALTRFSAGNVEVRPVTVPQQVPRLKRHDEQMLQVGGLGALLCRDATQRTELGFGCAWLKRYT